MNPKLEFLSDRDLQYYCQSFENLNASKSKERGIAPHKPILLLAVIDLINRGYFQDNKILISQELLESFKQYWEVLPEKYTKSFKSDYFYPFRHLGSESFWHLKARKNVDLQNFKPKSYAQLNKGIEYAYLDRNLFDLLQESESRKILIYTLISAWFSATEQPISSLLEINDRLQKQIPSYDKLAEAQQNPSFYNRRSPVRNALFRKTIVYIYDYRCALCHLKVTKSLTQNIVEGAHIVPFSLTYDNNINNGISFCKNHHWAFDNGLFYIDENYRIVVQDNTFEEDSPHSSPLKSFDGSPLLLPLKKALIPSHHALEWHRNRWSAKAS